MRKWSDPEDKIRITDRKQFLATSGISIEKVSVIMAPLHRRT